MFLTHFKFTSQPFAERVAADALWQDDRMQQGLARLRYLAEHATTLARYDLLAFENTCRAKYAMLGLKYPLEGEPLLSPDHLAALCQAARQGGLAMVKWSGPTLMDIPD